MCSTPRPAGAIVHDEARGEGISHMRVLRGRSPPCPLDRRAPTASTDGRSVGTSSAERDGAQGRGGVGRRREAAGGVHLPLCRLVPREPPIHVRALLRRPPARARLLRFWFGCAAQRSVTCCIWPGRPRRRRTATARRRRRMRHWTRLRAAASHCTADGGGDSAAALTPIAASGNGAPVAVPGVHVGSECDERSDDSAIAEVRRIVQRGVALAVHGGAGVRGWAPRGYPSRNRYPKTKQHAGPEGRLRIRFWVNVNGKEYSERTRSTRHPARASIKRAKRQKVAETAIAGEGGGEKL
jgi:hypothetical protein